MTEPAAGPCPAGSDTEAREALWERHSETSRRVAIAVGWYIEAKTAANQRMADIYWRALVELNAEHQAVRAALGLTDPKEPEP
jgi:hypothetical protein